MTPSKPPEWEIGESEELTLGQLTSISPSRFLAMKECPLRQALAANRVAAVLPSGPAARLGSVIHRLLEYAGRAEFAPGDVGAIDRKWEQLVTETEHIMTSDWLVRHLVPLKGSVPDFEVRRIQARQRALELAESSIAPGTGVHPGSPYGCEVPVSSPDRRVRGQIDAVLMTDQGPVLRDYKSGVIFESQTRGPEILKPAYQIQLRLYAALYALTVGEWPVRLEIVPIFGEAQEVRFDRNLCLALLEEAQGALESVNTVLTSGRSLDEIQDELARPTLQTCVSCTYRPICRPYRRIVEVEDPSNPSRDLWGDFLSLQKLGNGRLLIEIEAGGDVVRIRGLTPGDRHPALANLATRDRVGVFNLRQTGSPTTFAESPFTVIYRIRPSKTAQGS